ncbi:hypothetical protein EGM51_09935 [Verrucomicrobia bacterium S94]|nr:hypothetical protein EGM51_09935 [Verrucomicrobia bacterium S94]
MKEDNWSEHPELNRSVNWNKSNIQCIIGTAKVGDNTWVIRMNDFPDEPFHSLIINNQEVIHFNDWPEFWNKPK